jgi:hypothetical protein
MDTKKELLAPIPGPYNEASYTHVEVIYGKGKIYHGTMIYPGGHRGPCSITEMGLQSLILKKSQTKKA